MTDKQFAKIKPLSANTLNEMADSLDDSLALITLYCKRTKDDVATFSCNYEGDETLLFNALKSLFKGSDKINDYARQAYLSYLHDETVAGYKLKDE